MLPDSFTVTVRTRAVKTKLLGVQASGEFRIAVKAPPQDGKANRELLRFLKKETGRDAIIVTGLASRRNLIRLI